MKIVFFVAHLLGGGAERTVEYLSRYMSSKECEVIILSITNEVFYSTAETVKFVTLDIPYGHTNVFEQITKGLCRYYRAGKFIKQTKPDAIICLLPSTAKYAIPHRKKLGFKLITSERANINYVTSKKAVKEKIKTYLKSDGVIFQTERAKGWYSEDIQKKSVVIHNAVGNDLVYQVPEITERRKVVSAVGRLSEQKDYPTLFKAFQRVLEAYPDYKLEIFGDGPDRDNFIKCAEDLGVSESVKFMGVHKDAILKIADSSCYVLSSLYEGMPNALMEAMAAGLPCVSTDCPNGPAELIENEKNGILVPVGDSDALAEAMLRMIRDREFAQSCGKEAKKILDTHSVDIIAEQYLEFVKSVVSQEKRK